LVELVPIAAAEREFGAILQDHDVFSVEHRLKLLNPLDIHDGRTADAHESVAGQTPFECGHCFAHHVGVLADVECHIIVCRFNPVEITHLHEENPALCFYEKALDVFGDAIDALTERGVKHHVLVVGEGPARAWFQERIPTAVFTGELRGAELATAIASADVLLNPSVTEAFGNVTLEAMASALPVIAVNSTGSTNLVRDGETGLLADPGDVETIADELASYASDPELKRKHGEAGLAIAKTYDWDQINSAVLKTYERVIERRKRLKRLSRRWTF